jgi:hypothetical protein
MIKAGRDLAEQLFSLLCFGAVEAAQEFAKPDLVAEERQRELRERYAEGHKEGRTFGLMVAPN